MIGAELRGAIKPNLNEALGWIGSRVDDIYGAGVGRLEDVWIDPGTGMPRWLLVKEGRFGGRTTLIPFEDATAGAGHVWIPYERDVVREAPEVEPGAPLTQQLESALRAHYSAKAAAAVSHRHRNDPAATSAAARAEPPPHGHQAPAAPHGISGPAAYGNQPSAQPPAHHPHPQYTSVEAGSPRALGFATPPPPQADAAGTFDHHHVPPVERPAPDRRSQPPPLRPPAPPPRPAAPTQHRPPTSAAPQPAAPQPPPWQRFEAPTPLRAAPAEGAPAPGRPMSAVPPPATQPEPQPPEPEPQPPEPEPQPPEPDGRISLPRVDSLDQAYWIEIELEGGARLSGPVKGLRITPLESSGDVGRRD